MVKGKLALRAFASQAEDTRPELLQAPGGGIAATAVEGFSRRQNRRLN
jgi:hypothetical protein